MNPNSPFTIHHTPFTIHHSPGKVIFAGAGPGDPDLITVKAIRYLLKAEIVLTDRLVSEDILDTYVNKDAEIINVGKQCRRGKSTPQKDINEMLVEFALQGKLVIRLKGGDVSIFSNILDELEAVVANGIEYEIIPGITSASGASAYGGIPLTARGYANAVRFLTFYKSTVVTDDQWRELASTDDTLVFYMSSETLVYVADKLRKNNISEEKLVAVIEQATTPFQRVNIFNFYKNPEELNSRSFISPSLVIIGKVVGLHEQFKWQENISSEEYYFKPIRNSIVVKPGKANNHVSTI